jgi:hypothetical protein
MFGRQPALCYNKHRFVFKLIPAVRASYDDVRYRLHAAHEAGGVIVGADKIAISRATPGEGVGRNAPNFLSAPTRLMLLIANGARPDFSAISRCCSTARRLASFQSSEQLRGHAPVGTLRIVRVDDVEEGLVRASIIARRGATNQPDGQKFAGAVGQITFRTRAVSCPKRGAFRERQ